MQHGQKTVGHPVDVASGTMYSTHKDISIPGKVELLWERRYSTALLDMPPSPLGPGWTTRYFAALTRDKKEFQFLAPEGYVEIFSDPEGKVDRGGIVRNLGTFQELAKRGEHYIITRWDVDTGNVERYLFQEGRRGEAWPLASIEDVTGQGLDMLRDKAGRLTGIQQRLEKRTLRIEYTPNDLIESVSFQMPDDRLQVLARYEYDQSTRLSAAYNALDYADRYEYDATSRMTREIVKDGGVFYFKYDEQGRCIKTSGLDKYDEKSLRFFEGIQWTEVTNSLGNVSRYQWNQSGQVTREIDPLGGTRQTEYDQYGRIVAKIDTNGATTKYEYDEQGNRFKIIDPLGYEYVLTFNEDHLPITLTDPAGSVWKCKYDGSSRLIASEDPMGGRWTISYDGYGNLTGVTAPTGAYRRLLFSENGVLTEATDWVGNSTRYAFDKLGRIVERTGPLSGVTRIKYDPLGNPLHITFPDGSQIRCEYDSASNLTSLTNGNGYTTTLRYGPCRRLLEKVNRLGAVVKYHWGSEPKHLEKVVNEKGEIYSFVYDQVGRVVREKGFDDSEKGFLYDLDGRCTARVNGTNEAIAFKRDPIGRLVEQTLPDGTSAKFEYDYLGNLVSAVNSDCEVMFERDLLGRVTKEVQGGNSVESRFDAVGNLIHTATNLGHQADYVVDGNGLLTRLAIGSHQPMGFLRNAHGQETYRLLPGHIRLDQQYDAVGRLVAQRVGHSPLMLDQSSEIPRSSVIIHKVYGYDKSGTLTSINDDRWGAVSYIYDPAERLLHALRQMGGSEHFSYDTTGNITQISTEDGDELFEYGPGDRLLRKGHTRYFYDDNGRLVEKVENFDSQNPREWRYAWDALGQLSSVETPENEVWRYGYDALGRRTFKQGPGKQTRFVWDRNVIVHEIQDNHLESTWVFNQDNFTPLCKLQSGEVYSVVPDHLGTPRELVDRYGSIVWSASYKSWGGVQETTEGQIDCPIRFQGQWFDKESELHYNRFRYYDPESGRFLSGDPIGLMGSLNLYLYARNPINWVDPWGLMPLYRGALPGEPVSFQAEPKDIPKPERKAGIKQPGSGVSAYDNRADVEKFGRIPYEIDPATVPASLEIKPKGKPGHSEIMPKNAMPIEDYQAALGQIKTKPAPSNEEEKPSEPKDCG